MMVIDFNTNTIKHAQQPTADNSGRLRRFELGWEINEYTQNTQLYKQL